MLDEYTNMHVYKAVRSRSSIREKEINYSTLVCAVKKKRIFIIMQKSVNNKRQQFMSNAFLTNKHVILVLLIINSIRFVETFEGSCFI